MSMEARLSVASNPKNKSSVVHNFVAPVWPSFRPEAGALFCLLFLRDA